MQLGNRIIFDAWSINNIRPFQELISLSKVEQSGQLAVTIWELKNLYVGRVCVAADVAPSMARLALFIDLVPTY